MERYEAKSAIMYICVNLCKINTNLSTVSCSYIDTISRTDLCSPEKKNSPQIYDHLQIQIHLLTHGHM